VRTPRWAQLHRGSAAIIRSPRSVSFFTARPGSFRPRGKPSRGWKFSAVLPALGAVFVLPGKHPPSSRRVTGSWRAHHGHAPFHYRSGKMHRPFSSYPCLAARDALNAGPVSSDAVDHVPPRRRTRRCVTNGVFRLASDPVPAPPRGQPAIARVNCSLESATVSPQRRGSALDAHASR